MVNWPAEQNAVISLSFIGFFLVSVPLYWHLEAWNVGCVMYIFWSGSQCLIQFVNCIVWKDNAINWAPVWCDITSRWKLASGVGICVSSLIINRRLYKIATVSTVSLSRTDKRRMIYLDLSIGMGLPILQVILYWFIQGHRFNIWEGYGCLYVIDNTIPSYFLSTIWPIAIGLVSAVYCTLTLRAFIKRRKQMNELMSSNSNLTYHRYLRLMGLASLELCATVPLATWNLAVNIMAPRYTWKGLGDMHYDFSRVVQFPAVVWRMDSLTVRAFDFDMWTTIVCPLLFFAFFGLAEEARKHYYVAATTVAKRVGLSTTWLDRSGQGSSGLYASKPTTRSIGRITIPTFIQRRSPRHASLTSFSDRLSSSISIGDGDVMDDVKTPYSSSEHSAGSSTFIPSPVSDSKSSDPHFLALLPPSPTVARPEPVHDVATVERQIPNLPASVPRSDVDIV